MPNLLDKTLEDDIITEEESQDLIKARENLFNDAYLTANEDNFVTKEEKEILDKLMQFVQDFQEIEFENT